MTTGPRPHVTGVTLSSLQKVITGSFIGDRGTDALVTGITHDSRRVQSGDLYAALAGFNTHGAEFVHGAAAAGAVAILTDEVGRDRATATGLPVLIDADARGVLGQLSAAIYDRPSSHLIVVGITGTNGKTTTSYLLDAAFREAGFITGVIGTVGTRIGDEVVQTSRTTPEATDVHALLAIMRERGVTAVSMEVSSHALRLGRVDGVTFATVGFTNLTEDHLDFHRDMDDYFEAKASLFTAQRAGSAVVCVDDPWGQRMALQARESGLPVLTYGLDPKTDWSATEITSVPGGSHVTARGPEGDVVSFTVHLPGLFNVVNALAALSLACRVGISAEVAARGISTCGGVPGRMERIVDSTTQRGIVALVDYAHTPDAVDRAIAAAREGISGRTIVVLGAGGDRDRAKRPLMGQAAARHADVVIVTDDNPRSESPESIRAAVLSGTSSMPRQSVIEIGDRRAAITRAVELAQAGDVVLVLGKGHEQGQEIDGVVTPFDDRIVLAQALESASVDSASSEGEKS